MVEAFLIHGEKDQLMLGKNVSFHWNIRTTIAAKVSSGMSYAGHIDVKTWRDWRFGNCFTISLYSGNIQSNHTPFVDAFQQQVLNVGSRTREFASIAK